MYSVLSHFSSSSLKFQKIHIIKILYFKFYKNLSEFIILKYKFIGMVWNFISHSIYSKINNKKKKNERRDRNLEFRNKILNFKEL